MSANALPAVPEDIEKSYGRLVEDIDEAAARVAAALPEGTIHCAPGCTDCCIRFRVIALEASIIAAHYRRQQRTAPGTAAGESCPLLCRKECAIYPHRPIICRTQGLPLGYLDEETGVIELSACPRNFTEDFCFSEETVLLMDAFNARLADLNAAYCSRWGGDPLERFALAELPGQTRPAA